MLSFPPRDVFDEIWNLNESVSEGFLTHSSCPYMVNIFKKFLLTNQPAHWFVASWYLILLYDDPGFTLTSLKTNILYYIEHTLSLYRFYYPVMFLPMWDGVFP